MREQQLQCYGEFDVRMGDEHIGTFRNKVTGKLLRTLIAFLGQATGSNVTSPIAATTSLSAMRVGTGSVSTTEGQLSLANQIATAPNSISRVLDTPAGGSYRIRVIATWNAGTLSSITISEIGVFGSATDLAGTAEGFQLLARLSASDNEFTAFAVNPSVPLTIEWRFVLTWA